MKSRKDRMPRLAHTPLYLLVCAVLGAGFAGPAQADTTTTTMTYDAGDHVTSVTDPRNLVTTYAYDGLGQLWQQVSPDTGTTTYGYDANGHRTSMTRADSTVTTYGYDSLDRVVSVSAGGQTQSFAYDSCTNGLGRLCSASDSTGATSYTYTPEGWLAGRGFSISGTTYALGYGYDAMGHLAAVNYPDGHQAVYSYTDGVVTGVTLNLGGTSVTGASNITYRPGNLAMASWQSSNGLTNTLTYDTDGRLTGISVPNVQSLAFSYDTADRITSLTNGVDPSQSESYDYDDQSRLTGAYGTANTESYAYDADGNRIWQTVNGSVANFGISATSNQLMSISGAATQSYGYDAQGNTTTVNGVTTYQYNPFNRLSSTSGASDYVSPEGQRLRKISGGGTTYFAPEGSNLVAEVANGQWIDYVWLNGRLIGRINGNTVSAVHDDQLGRPQVATNASGIVVWKAINRSFEHTIAQDAIGGMNLGFPGQYFDTERGTWNNGYRDYDPQLGRYIESDPIGLNSGNNTYAYVNNNPLSGIDPYGLESPTVEPSSQSMYEMGKADGANLRLPDFVTFQIDVYVLSVSATYTVYGDIYTSLGTERQYKNPGSQGVSISDGWMIVKCPGTTPSRSQLNDFLKGYSAGASGYLGVGGGYIFNSSGSALLLGVGAGNSVFGISPMSYGKYRGSVFGE